jgi:hypothetical protein
MQADVLKSIKLQKVALHMQFLAYNTTVFCNVIFLKIPTVFNATAIPTYTVPKILTQNRRGH